MEMSDLDAPVLAPQEQDGFDSAGARWFWLRRSKMFSLQRDTARALHGAQCRKMTGTFRTEWSDGVGTGSAAPLR
jgi:hypothetical protein